MSHSEDVNLKAGEALKQRLIADGYGPLFEPLAEMGEIQINNEYRLTGLWAVGGQSVLFRIKASSHPTLPLLARLGLLAYHRPAYGTFQRGGTVTLSS